MRQTIYPSHGKQGVGLVCAHIAHAVDQGAKIGFFYGDDTDTARPDAWCQASLRGIGVIEALEAAFAHVRPGRLGDAAMSAAYTLIEAGPPSGARLVPWLARSLAMSERTLRRRFAESFGYGPKTLDRILRYRRFLRLSRTSQSPIAVIAAEAGYADQAHLVRECKRLSSVTPKDVVAYQPHDVRRGLSARDAGDGVRRP